MIAIASRSMYEPTRRVTSVTRRASLAQTLSLDDARRIALAAQGFDRPRPTSVTAAHLRRVFRQIGLIQIDSVNVLVPAHYQVPFSRLGPYDRTRFDDLIYRKREFTEQWAHEASIVPVEHWPLIRHHLGPHERRWGALSELMAARSEYAARVLEEVRARGPVVAGDIAEPDGTLGRGGGWWGWTIAKATLEGHFARGMIAIAERRAAGFARVYDLAERVVPVEHTARTMARDEAQRELVKLAARAMGVATARDIADYYRMDPRDARQRVQELASGGELREVRVDGWRELEIVTASGDEVIRYQYAIGATRPSNDLRAQVSYGLQSLVGAPLRPRSTAPRRARRHRATFVRRRAGLRRITCVASSLPADEKCAV